MTQAEFEEAFEWRLDRIEEGLQRMRAAGYGANEQENVCVVAEALGCIQRHVIALRYDARIPIEPPEDTYSRPLRHLCPAEDVAEAMLERCEEIPVEVGGCGG